MIQITSLVSSQFRLQLIRYNGAFFNLGVVVTSSHDGGIGRFLFLVLGVRLDNDEGLVFSAAVVVFGEIGGVIGGNRQVLVGILTWVVNASACCFDGMICIPPTRWYTIVSYPEIIGSDTAEM
ncbi:hypothetical protein F2Q69_00022463 [Brassica cretica]|uniref:Uncharacterized protein n=1 Tax=Brassica cretica TaxID=69181 RepID=A0A8S9Q6H2_BRACR|nr:hypothetical protein F2Q69_00022463 [Brassica cretica]